MRRDVEYEMRMHLKADSILSLSLSSHTFLITPFLSSCSFLPFSISLLSLSFPLLSLVSIPLILVVVISLLPPECLMYFCQVEKKYKKDDRRKKEKESVWVKEKSRIKQPNKISISQQTVFFSFFFASILEVLEQRTLRSSLWKKKTRHLKLMSFSFLSPSPHSSSSFLVSNSLPLQSLLPHFLFSLSLSVLIPSQCCSCFSHHDASSSILTLDVNFIFHFFPFSFKKM